MGSTESINNVKADLYMIRRPKIRREKVPKHTEQVFVLLKEIAAKNETIQYGKLAKQVRTVIKRYVFRYSIFIDAVSLGASQN